MYIAWFWLHLCLEIHTAINWQIWQNLLDWLNVLFMDFNWWFWRNHFVNFVKAKLARPCKLSQHCKENLVNLCHFHYCMHSWTIPDFVHVLYMCRQYSKPSAYLTVSGSWIKTSFTSYLGLIGFNSFILNLAVFFSKVSSFKLSNTFDFLFSIVTSKEESVNTIESLTTEYGDSPGWIARLFLQKKKEGKKKKKLFSNFSQKLW